MEVNKEQKSKTALNWLLDEYFGGAENCTPDFVHHIKIALEKEKEQITDAYYDGYLCDYGKSNIDGYYDETFES